MAQGLIDPNAPRPRPPETAGDDQPTDEEDKLCKQVEKLFERAAKHRRRYDFDWVNNYKMFRGDQWLKRRPTYKSREVINLIFQGIESQFSVMMDTRPQVGFLPQDPTDTEFAEILNQVFEADWQRNNWMDELAAVILDGHLYSVGHSYAGYNENLLGGKGGIEYCCKDTFECYPDPEATNVNKKATYFVTASPEDIDVVKARYAGHKYVDQIKPDLDDLSQSQRKVDILHIRKNTNLDLPNDRLASGSVDPDDSKRKVLVTTLYIHPTDTEQVEKDELKDDGTGETTYITRLKYPKGRKVVKINNRIFEDGPLDYDHLEFPFQRYVNYVLSREYFGMSDVEQSKGPQLVFNKLVNFSLDILTLMGNPVWKVPVEANLDTRKLSPGQPGLVIEYANGAEPKQEQGLSLQPSIIQMIDKMEQWFNNSMFRQDVTRGINPTGVTANAAIENLLDAAQKPLRQKMRNLDSYLKDFGRQWVSLAMQYYTAPQVFRLTNKDGANQFFKFHVEKRPMLDDSGNPMLDAAGQPQQQKVAIVRKYGQNESGKYEAAEMPDEYQIRGDFDVRVNTISGLPFSKAETEQKVLALFDRQIIDAEEVLSRLEYPNAQMIIQRMNERMAAQAQAQQQSQGA